MNLRAQPSEERQKDVAESKRQEREAVTAQVLQQVLAAKPVEVLPPPEEIKSAEPETEPENEPEPEPESESEIVVEVAPAKEKSIYFVYNGHEWECHDVLGMPRGASLKEATEKYQHLIKTSDPSTFPFYEAAFEAILKRKGTK